MTYAAGIDTNDAAEQTMNPEQYYQKLPVFAQNIACGIAGWKLQRSRFGSGFARLLELCEDRATWPEKRLLEFRDERTRIFVVHAANTMPYYRRKFAELGLHHNDIRTLDDMQKLPVLTKKEVQDNLSSFVYESIPKRKCVPVLTSDLDFAHEVCGDAAVYFDPWSVESIKEAIDGLRKDPQLSRRLVSEGEKRLKEMFQSWDEIAKYLLRELHDICTDK